MENKKVCSKCGQNKNIPEDFYRMRMQYYRADCKKCTILANVRRQKKNKYWLTREIDKDKAREYQKNYYLKNKEKYEGYKAKYKLKKPDYYKDYARAKKAKDLGSIL